MDRVVLLSLKQKLWWCLLIVSFHTFIAWVIFYPYHHLKSTWLLKIVEDMTIQDGRLSQWKQKTFQQMIWEQLELLTIDLSQFSLLLVATDRWIWYKHLHSHYMFKIMPTLFESSTVMQVDLEYFNLKLIFVWTLNWKIHY